MDLTSKDILLMVSALNCHARSFRRLGGKHKFTLCVQNPRIPTRFARSRNETFRAPM
jgi:hypothetical protein